MTLPTPREHDPAEPGAEDSTMAAEPAPPSPPPTRYPLTQVYMVLMVTFILLSVLFEWRI